MAGQLSFFDTNEPAGTGAYGNMRPAPPSNGTATSNEAAEAIRPHLNRLHNLILDALRGKPAGGTAEELEVWTGLAGNTVRPRCKELEAAGRIHRPGETRKTASGRSAYVWRLR